MWFVNLLMAALFFFISFFAFALYAINKPNS